MRALHAVVMGAICLAFVAAGCGGAIPLGVRRVGRDVAGSGPGSGFGFDDGGGSRR